MSKKNILVGLLALIVLTITAYYFIGNKRSTLSSPQNNFATEDTASIAKIVIEDTYSNKVSLSRPEGHWLVNDSLAVRKEAISFLLQAIHGFKVRGSVANASLELLFKRIAVNHVKVDLYEKGASKPFKTIFISDANTALSGNLALLETEEYGRSEKPFYIHLEGHKGIVKPIFFTNALEWMDTQIFKYPKLEFKSVTVQNFQDPAQSFRIEKSDEGVAIYDIKNLRYLNGMDTLFTYDYLSQYQMVYYEVRDHYLKPEQQDSLKNSQPIYQITVQENNGKSNSIKLFKKPEVIRTIDFDVTEIEEDRDRMYGLYKGNLVLCQKFTFNRILVKLDDFK